jgi:hypothetical protein
MQRAHQGFVVSALAVDSFRIASGILLSSLPIHRLFEASQTNWRSAVGKETYVFLLLSLLVTCGVAARCSAALLFAFLFALRPPVHSGGEATVIQALTFWLVLLPVGRTLTLADAGAWREWRTRVVCAWVPLEACACLSLTLLVPALVDPVAPDALRWCGSSAAAAAVVFKRHGRLVALPLSAIAIISALGIVSALVLELLAAVWLCTLIDLLARPPRPLREDDTLDGFAAIGGGVAVLMLLHWLAVLVPLPRTTVATERLLLLAQPRHSPPGREAAMTGVDRSTATVPTE